MDLYNSVCVGSRSSRGIVKVIWVLVALFILLIVLLTDVITVFAEDTPTPTRTYAATSTLIPSQTPQPSSTELFPTSNKWPTCPVISPSATNTSLIPTVIIPTVDLNTTTVNPYICRGTLTPRPTGQVPTDSIPWCEDGTKTAIANFTKTPTGTPTATRTPTPTNTSVGFGCFATPYAVSCLNGYDCTMQERKDTCLSFVYTYTYSWNGGGYPEGEGSIDFTSPISITSMRMKRPVYPLAQNTNYSWASCTGQLRDDRPAINSAIGTPEADQVFYYSWASPGWSNTWFRPSFRGCTTNPQVGSQYWGKWSIIQINGTDTGENPYQTLTPTATATATGTMTPGPTGTPMCRAEVTPGAPVVNFVPPYSQTGDCYTIVPGGTWNLPDWGSLPTTITIPGFQICINYLVISASLLGMQVADVLAVIGFIFCCGAVFRELRS